LLYIPEDSPENAEVFFIISGALEFRNTTTDETTGIFDWVALTKLQEKECEASGKSCDCLSNLKLYQKKPEECSLSNEE